MTDAATKTRHWTNYQVGQQVYGSFYQGDRKSMTVRSVGKKYVRFEGVEDNVIVERDSNTVVRQGYGRIGYLYESEQAYAEYCRISKLRHAITQLSYQSWIGWPPEKIEAIAEILGIES